MTRWLPLATASGFRSCRERNGLVMNPKNADCRLNACAVLFFVSFAVHDAEAGYQRTAFSTNSYCPSYCSTSNNYEPGFYCPNHSYCCGDRSTRYCCNNGSLSFGSDYTDVCYVCVTSPCGFLDEWSVILLSTAVVLVAGLVTVFCCHCYAGGYYITLCELAGCCNSHSSRASPASYSDRVDPPGNTQSNRRTRRMQRTDVESVEVQNSLGDFDPSHPFAFRPPNYDEFSMADSEPPKYDDIQMIMSSRATSTENADGRTTNAAFELEEDGSSPSIELRPRHSDSWNHVPMAATGSECAIRVDVSAMATESVESSSPPAYEDAIVTVPLSSEGAEA